jgi:hypothetical protein
MKKAMWNVLIFFAGVLAISFTMIGIIEVVMSLCE